MKNSKREAAIQIFVSLSCIHFVSFAQEGEKNPEKVFLLQIAYPQIWRIEGGSIQLLQSKCAENGSRS